MSFPVHPLLGLLEDNRNGLKSLLTHHIDATVDYQFDLLKNTILRMITTGHIDPLYEDTENALSFSTQNTFTTYQSNVDHANLSILHHSNGHLDTAYNQNIMPSEDVNALGSFHSQLNTTQVNSSNEQCPLSGSIPINVQCNDALNNHDKEQLNNIAIDVNDGQNGQVPMDDVKEEYDDDDDEDYYEDEGEHMSGSDECEDCANGICGLDGENYDGQNDGQNDAQNDIDNNYLENNMISSKLVQNLDSQNDDVEDQLLQTSQQIVNNDHSNTDKPVTQQSNPSTSGLRSSGRKRIQKKLIGDDQSNGQVKSDKRKCTTRSSKTVNKVKNQEVEEEKDDDDEEEEVTKLKIITLKVNCTETGCKKFFKSCKMWKKHLSSIHGQMPYKELDDNVRPNQHGHTEYPCIACAVECKSQDLLYKHWRNNHLAGKYKCSDCAFVANFSSKVRTHQRNNHRSNRFQCTHQGCNRTFAGNRDLEQHQRIHNGDRPFVCAWDNCGSTFNQHSHAICHVRTKHFRLPSTVKEQHELNIIEDRDPKVYVQVMS